MSFENIGAVVGDRINVTDIDANTGAANDQDFIFTETTAGGVRSLWVVDDDTGTNSFILGNVNGSAAPELQIIVADGAAVAADWVAGDFIV